MPDQLAFASQFEFTSDNRAVIISLTGWLDPEAVDELHPQVQEVYRAGVRHFVFDLSRLHHIGSLGIRLLLGLQNQVKGEGRVTFYDISEPVRLMLKISRLNNLLPEYPSRDEALAATGM